MEEIKKKEKKFPSAPKLELTHQLSNRVKRVVPGVGQRVEGLEKNLLERWCHFESRPCRVMHAVSANLYPHPACCYEIFMQLSMSEDISFEQLCKLPVLTF